MYIIFAGQNYYPSGGMNDYEDGLGRFSDYNDALRAVATLSSIDWWQIVRIQDDELFIVDSGSRN